MSSTRSVVSPPIFAEDAATVIPPTPIAGVSYRDPVAGPASSPDGWAYAERVNSAEFNQIMFLVTSLVGVMDKKGVLGWSDQVDYTEAAITFGSDGVLYTWLAASGPNNGGAKDPVSNPTFWQSLTNALGVSGEIKMYGGATAPAGWFECDGAAVSRTTYAALFAAVGTAFGPGNGTTTFNLPDFRGEFPRGWDNGRGVDAGRARGSSQVGQGDELSMETRISTQAGVLPPQTTIVPVNNTPSAWFNTGDAVSTTDVDLRVTSNGADLRPRNVAVMFIIKS